MIECIFTLDYEMYGNGRGKLDELVYEPARELITLFTSRDVRFVNFVEVIELEKIEECGTDAGIDRVKRQVAEMFREDFEIALHLHPQWCNAVHANGTWRLDASEYNLCTLKRTRIAQIVNQSLDYLRYLVGTPTFAPIAFRAGNWLFQPTEVAAGVLYECGLRIDSSVFKGGLQHNNGLDYRESLGNGYYWRFGRDVNVPDQAGLWLEVPIHTEMVPSWKMRTSKRLALSRRGEDSSQSAILRLNRMRDFLRFRYPLKLDFCRMTIEELTSVMARVIRDDHQDPDVYKPIVLIGHTKDLTDLETVSGFLSYLKEARIAVTTFRDAYSKLSGIASIHRQPAAARA